MRYLLAGESHGPALVGVIEGMPAGLPLAEADIDRELARRREGHGRGVRAREIEVDRVRLLAGLWEGRTLGSPLAFVIENRDHALRRGRPARDWTAPRPGHADFAGMARYGFDSCAPAAERASARSTAGLTAVGACAKALLRRFGVQVLSHVTAIGPVAARPGEATLPRLRRIQSGTPVRCLDRHAAAAMVDAIDAARAAGSTLGGVFEVVAFGLPAGLGSYAHPDRRLDALLAADLMAIPSVKAVEIGAGVAVARGPGEQAHDEIVPAAEAPARRSLARRGLPATARTTNRAGGLEGGVTDGQPLVARGHAKPISTLRRGLRSVDLRSGAPARAPYVRSDVCVVPAAGVVGEAVMAWRLACLLVEEMGGAEVNEMRRRWDAWLPPRAARGAAGPAAGARRERE